MIYEYFILILSSFVKVSLLILFLAKVTNEAIFMNSDIYWQLILETENKNNGDKLFNLISFKKKFFLDLNIK